MILNVIMSEGFQSIIDKIKHSMLKETLRWGIVGRRRVSIIIFTMYNVHKYETRTHSKSGDFSEIDRCVYI